MDKYNIKTVTVTPFQQNCALIWKSGSNKGVIVDPGGEPDLIMKEISNSNIEVERILITHGHIDHIGGATALAKSLAVPIEGPHEDDLELINDVVNQAGMFGLSGFETITPDRWLAEGDSVEISGESLSVLHCPGHSPGHVVFVDREAGFAILGDVLFNGSIGRTDLPGGDFDALMQSIKGKLLTLGDEVEFICGHGPSSTIGYERRTNPFLQ